MEEQEGEKDEIYPWVGEGAPSLDLPGEVHELEEEDETPDAVQDQPPQRERDLVDIPPGMSAMSMSWTSYYERCPTLGYAWTVRTEVCGQRASL